MVGDQSYVFSSGRGLFERVALSDDFVEFLTLPAYDFLLERIEGAAD